MAEEDKKPAVNEESPPTSPVATADEFHDGTEEGKKAFLASFSSAEDKEIMRKVDRRFLVLIGLIYVLKNVCEHRSGSRCGLLMTSRLII